jgi:uncharacterized protein YlxW (UPF0749 family)
VARSIVSRWQAAVALFLVAVGFLVVAQLRSRQPLRQASALPSWRLQELAVLIRQQEDARKLLEVEVDTLRRQAHEYEAAVTAGRGFSQAMADEVARYRLVLGMVPVAGSGVRVVVSEGSGVHAGVLPPMVQAEDLSGLANEMWSAGAEAMAINGIRVVATTGIRQAGDGLMLGNIRVHAPYRIDTIGDPAALQAALAIKGGFVEGLRSVGLRVEVRPQQRLHLPPRPGAEPFRYARPREVP